MPVTGARHVPDFFRGVGKRCHIGIDHGLVRQYLLQCRTHRSNTGTFYRDLCCPTLFDSRYLCRRPARVTVISTRRNGNAHRRQKRARVSTYRQIACPGVGQDLRIQIDPDHLSANVRAIPPQIHFAQLRPRNNDQIGFGQDGVAVRSCQISAK